MTKHMLGRATLALLLASACTDWNSSTRATRPYTDWARAAPRNTVDEAYATEALRIGRDQVRLSQIALERSSNPEVREFARRQILDHGRFNEAMLEIGDEQGLPLPDPGITARGEEVLASLTGAEFDAAYLAMMQRNLQRTYDLHQQETAAGMEVSLQVNAEMQKEPLSEHLQDARRLRARYG